MSPDEGVSVCDAPTPCEDVVHGAWASHPTLCAVLELVPGPMQLSTA
jgi:hypothetical protein